MNPENIILHPLGAALLFKLKDQAVEIYCGDVKTTRLFSDVERAQKNLIKGIIRDAVGDLLILECNKGGFTGTAFINVWSIQSVMKETDDLFISDIYEDEEAWLQERRKAGS